MEYVALAVAALEGRGTSISTTIGRPESSDVSASMKTRVGVMVLRTYVGGSRTHRKVEVSGNRTVKVKVDARGRRDDHTVLQEESKAALVFQLVVHELRNLWLSGASRETENIQSYANSSTQPKRVSVKVKPCDYGLDRQRGDNFGELDAAWHCIDHLRKQLCARRCEEFCLRAHGNVSVAAKNPLVRVCGIVQTYYQGIRKYIHVVVKIHETGVKVRDRFGAVWVVQLRNDIRERHMLHAAECSNVQFMSEGSIMDLDALKEYNIFLHGIIDPTIANIKLIMLLYKEKVEWQVIEKKKEWTEEFWVAVEGLVAESVNS
ncbi:hypothetical protein K438DRAFT_1755393 [Mycena galopus ATCC 62051]|nr:hypothetical protein K438DRAFT_1755393 [Mycena galopus ATCC 62051]